MSESGQTPQVRTDLKGLDWEGFEAFLRVGFDVSAERAERIFKAIWQDGVTDLLDVADISRELLRRLAEVAYVSRLEPEKILESQDGTTKFLWRLHDGRSVESVLIPDGRRLTLCMSSQVGCAMGCRFCLTGDLGLIRHLNTAEIADQALQVQLRLGKDRRITNLVFMGMGEPLHNLSALLPALRLCLDDRALHFSHRRVTVSTVGLVPKMAQLAAALPVNLAVSLNATTEEQRLQIMPITRKYSLKELLDGCRAFPLSGGKRIAFEYVMIAGFNDTLEDADRLVGLLEGIPAKVNLIPYNENPDRDLRRPTKSVVEAFRLRLLSQGRQCTVRVTRGLDVSAACGQLGKAREQAASRARLSVQAPTV